MSKSLCGSSSPDVQAELKSAQPVVKTGQSLNYRPALPDSVTSDISFYLDVCVRTKTFCTYIDGKEQEWGQNPVRPGQHINRGDGRGQ